MVASKARLVLECKCDLCKMEFVIFNNWVPKHIGSGMHISGLGCPNCGKYGKLDFDIMLEKTPKVGLT